eukprot:7391004-Prymnesium_polylepis.1
MIVSPHNHGGHAASRWSRQGPPHAQRTICARRRTSAHRPHDALCQCAVGTCARVRDAQHTRHITIALPALMR